MLIPPYDKKTPPQKKPQRGSQSVKTQRVTGLTQRKPLLAIVPEGVALPRSATRTNCVPGKNVPLFGPPRHTSKNEPPRDTRQPVGRDTCEVIK